MADGIGGIVVHGRIVAGAEASAMTLDTALGAGHLVSKCAASCGHIESVDTSEWHASRSRTDTLQVLARHLRCICGCREVRLEVWPMVPTNESGEHRTYFWR